MKKNGWVTVVIFAVLILSLTYFIPISYQQVNPQSPNTNTTDESTNSTTFPGTPADTSTTDASIIVTPLAALGNVIVEPSNNLFNLESHYVIGFNTATTGNIKFITITFPAGFNIANAKLIEAGGIGTGSTSVSGQTLTYTVSSPVSISSGKTIMIMLGKMVNNAVASNTVSITTKDGSSIVIDGPTTSPTFTLQPVSTPMLGITSVTQARIATGAVTLPTLVANSVNSSRIVDGS